MGRANDIEIWHVITIIATTGSEQGSKFNSCIASKILNFNQQIDPKCIAQIPKMQCAQLIWKIIEHENVKVYIHFKA
jgi:hypothetical protein